MQSTSVMHGVEHHLFDDPLVVASSQCEAVHLQQQFDDAVLVIADHNCISAGRPVTTLDDVSAPLRLQTIGNHVRGPPLISLN